MIRVIVHRDDNRNIVGLVMSGHAGYDESGKDIVCAGASTLLYTAVNALEDICGYDSEETLRLIDEGDDVNARITVPMIGDEACKTRAQVIMRTVELGMISLASSVNTDEQKYVEIFQTN